MDGKLKRTRLVRQLKLDGLRQVSKARADICKDSG